MVSKYNPNIFVVVKTNETQILRYIRPNLNMFNAIAEMVDVVARIEQNTDVASFNSDQQI